MDCRFNKKDLIKRIRLIAGRRRNIHLYNLDAMKLIEKIEKKATSTSTIFYFDPPYYLKGQSLYLNYYKHDDHLEVSNKIQSIKNISWIVSYDNTKEIREMYKACNGRELEFMYTANKKVPGREALFFSDNLTIPGNCKLNLRPLS